MPQDVVAERLAAGFWWLQQRARVGVVLRCDHADTPDRPAFRSDAPEPPELVDDSGPGSELSGVPSIDWVLVVLDGCLGDREPATLVDLAIASGGPLVMDVAGCQRLKVTEVEYLTAVSGGRVRASQSPPRASQRVELAHPPVSRRGLLRADQSVVPVAHRAADPQGRLVESLRVLLPPGTEVPGPAPGLALAAAGCIACGVCVQACPHDALELKTVAQQSLLAHHADRCRGEQQCVTHCPVDALTVVGPQSWTPVLAGRPLPLARLATTRCERCRATIPLGTTMCEPCRRRTERPFGWHVPDAVRDQLPAKWRDRLDG